jgi:hypothetical protein
MNLFRLIMKLTIGLLCIFALIRTIGAPPAVDNAKRNKQQPESKNSEEEEDVVRKIDFFVLIFILSLQLDNLEYSRYLKEVVEILETDPDFKQKLQNASSEDIKVLKYTEDSFFSYPSSF